MFEDPELMPEYFEGMHFHNILKEFLKYFDHVKFECHVSVWWEVQSCMVHQSSEGRQVEGSTGGGSIRVEAGVGKEVQVVVAAAGSKLHLITESYRGYQNFFNKDI